METNPLRCECTCAVPWARFELLEPLPTLIKAATTERESRQGDVRRTVLEGIAVLADNVGGDDKHFTSGRALREQLLPRRPRTAIRGTRDVAAVAMGVIVTPEFRERLGAMLEDSSPDACATMRPCGWPSRRCVGRTGAGGKYARPRRVGRRRKRKAARDASLQER